MRVTATSNVDVLIKRYKNAPKRIDTAVRVATTSVGVLAQRELTGPEALRMFPRHPRNTPTPSRAWIDPPAQVTTKLRTTVKRESARPVGFAHYTIEVYPTMAYARAQELGRPEIGLPVRPYVEPTRQRLIKSGAALRLYREQMVKRLNGPN